MAMISGRTAFNPSQHGFHFGNYFVNQLAQLPGGRAIRSAGRCGGMSYAALDCFYAGHAAPGYTSAEFAPQHVPADGTRLADYIWKRQVNSLLVTTSLKYLTWWLLPDRSLGPIPGVTHLTKRVEFAKLRRSIDLGAPAVLVLLRAARLSEMMNNHQVVAWGYDYDPATEAISIHLYDSNHPDEAVSLSSQPGERHFTESTGEVWRGFHVHTYKSRVPPALTL